jgi:phage terminase large subunit-like protein
MDALIRQGRFHHVGSPLMRWCLSNVVCKEDAAGNVYPRKTHEKLKIDLIIAAVMAMAGWIQEEENESVYETRGIRILTL